MKFLEQYGIDFIFLVTVIAAMQIETFMAAVVDEFLNPYIHEDAELDLIPGSQPLRLTCLSAIMLRTFIIFMFVWAASRMFSS